MASRKPARTGSGQTRTESASPAGSGNARRGGAAGTSGTAVQGGKTGRSATQGTTRQNTARQNSRPQGGRGQGGRGQGGRGQGGRGQGGRGQGGRGQGPDGRGSQAGQLGRATATQARLGGTVVSPAKAVPAYSAPLWVQLAALVLSVGGLGMSIYLTIAHYTTTAILACSNKGYIDCAKVTTSAQSIVFGVFPVAVLGLAFYVFMVAINTPWAWRWQHPLIPWVRTGGIITGIGFVLYLVYAEVIEIGNICLLCTIVHIITFLLFVLLISVAPFFKTQADTR
jgi:uncharacterized membrane protein